MAGDKFMPEIHLKQLLDLPLVVVGHSQKKQEYKNSKKQETPDMPIGTNYRRPDFIMIWHIEISKTYPEQELLTKYYLIRHSKLQVI